MVKLTSTQKECLTYMAEHPNSGCIASNTYKPTNRLVELGLATRHRDPAYITSSRFKITDAGKDVVASMNKAKL